MLLPHMMKIAPSPQIAQIVSSPLYFDYIFKSLFLPKISYFFSEYANFQEIF